MRGHGYYAYPGTYDLDRPIPLPRHYQIVTASWCCDGTRDMILERPVLYVSPDGEKHFVEPKTRINGLSVLRMLWRICWPFEPITRDASVVHDSMCDEGCDWKYAAWVFYHAMLAAYEHASLKHRWKWLTKFMKARFAVKVFNRWAAVRYVGIWFQNKHRR